MRQETRRPCMAGDKKSDESVDRNLGELANFLLHRLLLSAIVLGQAAVLSPNSPDQARMESDTTAEDNHQTEL